ncbi:WXG100 family type VII secretion target [Mycobacterium sp. ACS4331]|uniref:WXG100 family type VII secretion target n=1 Tax=Mycobacterium sp. ACS4331 TaxID=1834121 RepID=UPI0007FE7A89|nr:WXG100 family type VII secretion target [Mycobacterium sp. ACS4331]OBF25940.1 hypothetical protein A5727_03845 [Mycobacterium sp. ACS4331]
MTQITYNKAAIADSADRVAHNAAGMGDDYTDVHNRTNALLGEFGGANATTYAYNQAEFMKSFEHLIETVTKFAHTVHTVLGNATDTDNSLATMM